MHTAKLKQFLHEQEQLSAIPEEIIIEEILLRLPVKSLVRFRCVCRSWNSLLSDRFIQYKSNHSFFRKLNDDYYLIVNKKDALSPGSCNISILSRADLSETQVPTLPYPRSTKGLHLLGSINGLVCMAYLSQLEFYFVFWNPFICLFKKIFPPSMSLENLIHYKLGFGWASEANDYRIIVKSSVSPHNIVYSSKADSWTKRVDYVAHHTYRDMCWTPSIIVNGCPYWNCCSGYNLVLKFEVQSNLFRNLIIPFGPRYSLVTISDCLALIKHAYASDGSASPNMDVYSFDEECRLWSKTYSINFEPLHISACLKVADEIVFNGKETLYNHKMKEFTSDKGYFYNGFSYTPSLVALKGMREVGEDHFLPRP